MSFAERVIQVYEQRQKQQEEREELKRLQDNKINSIGPTLFQCLLELHEAPKVEVNIHDINPTHKQWHIRINQDQFTITADEIEEAILTDPANADVRKIIENKIFDNIYGDLPDLLF